MLEERARKKGRAAWASVHDGVDTAGTVVATARQAQQEASPTMSVAEMEAAGRNGSSSSNVHESPLRDVATLVLALSVTTAISVLRGPNYAHSPLGMHCGSTAYWGSTLVQLAILLAVSLHTRRLLLSRLLRFRCCWYLLADREAPKPLSF